MKVSSMGDMEREVTLFGEGKQQKAKRDGKCELELNKRTKGVDGKNEQFCMTLVVVEVLVLMQRVKSNRVCIVV